MSASGEFSHDNPSHLPHIAEHSRPARLHSQESLKSDTCEKLDTGVFLELVKELLAYVVVNCQPSSIPTNKDPNNFQATSELGDTRGSCVGQQQLM